MSENEAIENAHETLTLARAAFAAARTGRELGDAWGSWAGTLRALPPDVSAWAMVDAADAWRADARRLEVPEGLASELRRLGKSPPPGPSSSAPGALLEGLSVDVARAPTEPPGPRAGAGPQFGDERAEPQVPLLGPGVGALEHARVVLRWALERCESIASNLESPDLDGEWGASELRALVRQCRDATGIAA